MAAGCSGGYDVTFVEEDRHLEYYHKYMCVICRLLARTVHQVNCCGKLLCNQCYETQRRTKNQCPTCRGPIDGRVFHDTYRQQEILSLKVFCYNREHGCDWSGEIRYLENDHLKVCIYKLIICQNCREKVPESVMGAHLAENCSKRAYRCPYCNKTGIYDDINNHHLEECPERPIECPNSTRGCFGKMKRKEIEEHRKVCNYELISCRYQPLGCNIMISRMEKQRHECMCPHKPPEERNMLIGDQRLLHVRQNVLPLHFRIDQFTSRWQNNEVWQQDFFTSQEGYYMCLKVHLNHGNSFLSCFIHIKQGPYDDILSWPFKGIFEIALQNQKEDKNHHVKEIKFLTSKMEFYNKRSLNCECPLGLGEPQYIAQYELNESRCRANCEYLQSDQLLLHVSIKSAESCNKYWRGSGMR